MRTLRREVRLWHRLLSLSRRFPLCPILLVFMNWTVPWRVLETEPPATCTRSGTPHYSQHSLRSSPADWPGHWRQSQYHLPYCSYKLLLDLMIAPIMTMNDENQNFSKLFLRYHRHCWQMKIIKLVLLPLLFLWITVSMVGPYSTHLRSDTSQHVLDKVFPAFSCNNLSLAKIQKWASYQMWPLVFLFRELVQSNNTATDHQVDTEASEASQLHHHQEDGFQSWWSRQSELKENVRKTCAKYGHSLNIKVPLKEFMYDPNHKLLFCRNAKVH